MPANLPPQYYELEREFKRERDPREKLRLAKELLAIMPKHKGTDKLQADMKAKISLLKKQIDGGGKKHGARRGDLLDHIDKEGAAQIVFIGPPNSGKSTIIDSLTNARPLIGDYPYTTRQPLAGMMEYDTVQYQLVDTPPISKEQFENFMPNIIRQSDIIALVVDVSDLEFESKVNELLERLEEKRITLVPEEPEVVEDPRFCFKKTIVLAHKYLDENGDRGLTRIKELFPEFKIVPTSILEDGSMDNFKAAVFKLLRIIRVYTKRVGQEPSYIDPVILPIGGTVEDAAIELHKDFAHKLQYARVWGKGKFEGQRVKNNYVLSDGDVIEFHV